MSLRSGLLALAALLAAAAAAFFVFERELAGAWFAFGVHPDVVAALEASLEDQKRFAELDPAHEETYRRSFAEIDTLRKRLRVVEHNRRAIVRRFALLLFAAFGAVLAAALAAYAAQKARDRRRLERLRSALEDLCAGEADIRLAETRRDAIGRVAAMIESTSRLVAAHRRRLHALENLSAWQEAARRHAHEMRTPLTAARLEVERLSQVASELGGNGAPVEELAGSLAQELERLAAFTRRFTSFARLPQPRPVRLDLGALAGEFVATFGEAWPNLRLELEPIAPGQAFTAEVDREMLRQVLVNLCDNSSHAVGEDGGTVRLSLASSTDGVALSVADDGWGIAPEVRRRLFEPYATTRKVGEGMGLGLAIAKKIMLDHGGDLELVSSHERGTTFRLLFPRPDRTPPPEAARSESEPS